MVKVSAITCPKCLCTIYSRARHDFRRCGCGAIHIDGGFDYLKMGWDEKVEKPRPFYLQVNATKEQLYQDWNNSEDKFGIIYPQIESKRKEKRKMNKRIVPQLQEHSKRKKK